MTAIRIIDDHLEIANIGTNTHDQIDTHIAAADDYVKRDGSLDLTADWDIGDARKILADEIRARDGDGLKLYDDGGNGIFVEDGGNVGIGTDGPGAKLDVRGSLYLGNTPAFPYDRRFKIFDDGVSGNARIALIGTAGKANPPAIEFVIDGAANKRAVMRLEEEGSNDYGFSFWTTDNNNVQERMRIDGDGNVGIGTASPSGKFQVEGSSFPVIRGVRTTSITNGVGAGLDFVIRTSNNMLDGFGGGMAFSIQDDTAGPNYIVGLYGVREGADNSGGLVIYTNNAGSCNEKVRVDKTGNVGINTATPTAKLDVNSDIFRVRTAKTPASAGAAGNTGDWAWDADYFYICVATNTWERTAHDAWV